MVSGIYERDRRLLEFLEHRGIRPRARVHVAGRNYDQTLTLDTDAGTVALGGSAAEKVWVTAADPRLNGGRASRPSSRADAQLRRNLRREQKSREAAQE